MQDSLKRQGKRAEVTDGRVFLPGTLADRAMRKFLEQYEGHVSGQMAQFVDDLWDEYAVNSTEYKIKWRGDPRVDQQKVREIAKRCVTNLEPFLFQKVLMHEWQPEMAFSQEIRLPDLEGRMREVILVGRMDIAVLELPDREWAWLYDLKLTENAAYIKSSLGQLIFYSLAWSIMRGHPADKIGAAFLAPVCETQYWPLEIEADDRRQMLSRILRYCQSRWSTEPVVAVDCDGAPTSSSTCYNCDVKHACPNRSGTVTTNAKGQHRVDLMEQVRQRVPRL